MNVALAVSAEQVNYNLPGVTEHLKLNGKVLAAMYQGTIKTWNDPQIATLNPGVNLPATPVVPLHRSDGSGDTFVFTQYLSKQDPDGWGKSPGYNTTTAFPAVPGALGENGAGGMVTGCAQTAGCVAYIGTSYLNQASQKGLGEAELANASGNYLLPDAQSVGAEAAGFAAQTPANQVVSLIKGSRRRADDAGVPALGGDGRQQPDVPGPVPLPAAAGFGGEAIRCPDRQDLRLSSFGDASFAVRAR
jgi:phosphate transport system substrate-binding protein